MNPETRGTSTPGSLVFYFERNGKQMNERNASEAAL